MELSLTDEQISRVIDQFMPLSVFQETTCHILPASWFDMNKHQLGVFSDNLMKYPTGRIDNGFSIFDFADLRDACFSLYAMTSSGYCTQFYQTTTGYYVVLAKKTSDDEGGESTNDLG